MSGLAKVFVVVNAVLSFLFFGTSATLFLTRQDWNAKYQALLAAAQADKKKLQLREAELKKLADDQSDAILSLRKHEGELAEKLKVEASRVELERTRAAKAENQAQVHSQALETANNTVAEKTKAYEQLVQRYEDAQKAREAAIAEQKKAIDERDRLRRDLATVTGDLQGTRKEFVELEKKHLEMELLIARLTKKYGEPSLVPTPDIDAFVHAVDNDDQLVVLSVGAQDAVKEGYEFTVYRQDEFIGKVRVTKVWADVSGAEVLFTKEGAQIHTGDRATTNIN